jgi:hypothetical protein
MRGCGKHDAMICLALGCVTYGDVAGASRGSADGWAGGAYGAVDGARFNSMIRERRRRIVRMLRRARNTIDLEDGYIDLGGES